MSYVAYGENRGERKGKATKGYLYFPWGILLLCSTNSLHVSVSRFVFSFFKGETRWEKALEDLKTRTAPRATEKKPERKPAKAQAQRKLYYYYISLAFYHSPKNSHSFWLNTVYSLIACNISLCNILDYIFLLVFLSKNCNKNTGLRLNDVMTSWDAKKLCFIMASRCRFVRFLLFPKIPHAWVSHKV